MSRFYFCGSIRGGRELAPVYASIIAMMKTFGPVLTEHLGSDQEIEQKDRILTDRQIHDRDLNWIIESDLVVAEVTVPSLGVGYEIGRAIHLGKPVVCLFNSGNGHELSAMIAGCRELEIIRYRNWEELARVLKAWIEMRNGNIKS